MATIGSLIANLGLETAAFHKDLGKAVEALNSSSARMNRSISNIERGFTMVSRAVVAVAGPAAMGMLIKSQVDAADQMNKTAQILGTTVEKWSAYTFAAKLANVEHGQLQQGLVNLGDQMQDAIINKGGAAARTFAALGVAVVGADGQLRKTDAVVEDIARRFAGAEDGINKTNASIVLFGKRTGPALVPLLNSLQELSAEAQRAGAIVSTQFAQDAEQFNDNLTRLNTGVGALARTISGPLIGGLNDMIETFNVWAGIQERVSTQVLRRELDSLEKTMKQIAATGAGMFGDFVSEEQMSRLKARIAELNREIEARSMPKGRKAGTGGAGGESDIPAIGPDPAAFQRMMDGMRQASARAQTDILADEYSKTQARIKLAESEWRAKAEAANLGKEQRMQFEQELQQFLLDRTAVELTRVAAEKEAKQRAAFEDFERLRTTFDAEYAAEEEKRIRLLELDTYYREFDLEQDARYKAIKEQIELEHQARLLGMSSQFHARMMLLWQQGAKGRIEVTRTLSGELAGLMQSSSKTMFEIGKKAALSEAAISMYQSISNALATKPFFPLGLAMGAVATLKGIANISAIRSQQFGGAAAATPTFSANPSTGMPTSPLTPAAPPDPDRGGDVHVQVIVQGNMVGNDEFIEDMIEGIKDRVRNRDEMLIEPGSRNATLFA